MVNLQNGRSWSKESDSEKCARYKSARVNSPCAWLFSEQKIVEQKKKESPIGKVYNWIIYFRVGMGWRDI